MEIKCLWSIFQKNESEEDIPGAGTSKDVLAEDLHTTPKRAISTLQFSTEAAEEKRASKTTF